MQERLAKLTRIYVVVKGNMTPAEAASIDTITQRYEIHRTDGLKSGPVFINMPYSPTVGQEVFLTTPRARDAAYYTIWNSLFTNPKRSGERLDAIQAVQAFSYSDPDKQKLRLSTDFPLELNLNIEIQISLTGREIIF